jgi:hypothetical protein
MSCPAAAADPEVGASSATLIGPESAERVGAGTTASAVTHAAASTAILALVDSLIGVPPS